MSDEMSWGSHPDHVRESARLARTLLGTQPDPLDKVREAILNPPATVSNPAQNAYSEMFSQIMPYIANVVGLPPINTSLPDEPKPVPDNVSKEITISTIEADYKAKGRISFAKVSLLLNEIRNRDQIIHDLMIDKGLLSQDATPPMELRKTVQWLSDSLGNANNELMVLRNENERLQEYIRQLKMIYEGT